MKFVSSTTSSNDDYNAEFDFAFVDVGPELARQILERHAMFVECAKRDKNLWEMYFWDSSPDFFPGPAEEWFANLDLGDDPPSGEVYQIEKDVVLDGLGLHRYECGQMILCEEGVRWTCIPKHASFYITTETIPIAWIREIVAG